MAWVPKDSQRLAISTPGTFFCVGVEHMKVHTGHDSLFGLPKPCSMTSKGLVNTCSAPVLWNRSTQGLHSPHPEMDFRMQYSHMSEKRCIWLWKIPWVITITHIKIYGSDLWQLSLWLRTGNLQELDAPPVKSTTNIISSPPHQSMLLCCYVESVYAH